MASLRPAPRPRASVTRSSITSERAPPGRKEKRLPPQKRPRSPGAAILPAQCLPGQLGLQMGLQVGLQASARAAARARPQEPVARAAGAGAGAEAALELGLGAGPGAGSGGGVGLWPAARAREAAEPEARVRTGAGAGAGAGPEARVLAAPLGLDPRPDPGLRRPWWRSRFLQ